MKEEIRDYRDLLERFLARELAVEQFQAMYLAIFKNESRRLDEPEFLLLDELFGDVDSFTADPELLAEQPDFYIDEQTLRAKVRHVAANMHGLV